MHRRRLKPLRPPLPTEKITIFDENFNKILEISVLENGKKINKITREVMSFFLEKMPSIDYICIFIF